MSICSRRRAATLLAASLLAGCATVQAPAPGALSGRLAVSVAAPQPRNVSTLFELFGDAERGSLSLSTPLGTTLAQARWQPGDVRLLTSDGEQRFADLDALAREALGESVPMAALFDWLRGRPWPGAPSTPLPGGGFEQVGWQIDLARFGDGQVEAKRVAPPAVSVRARLDRGG